MIEILKMTEEEFYNTTETMLTFGGSFVQALAWAARKADRTNRYRLMAAFPEYFVEKYGPKSELYQRIKANSGEPASS